MEERMEERIEERTEERIEERIEERRDGRREVSAFGGACVRDGEGHNHLQLAVLGAERLQLRRDAVKGRSLLGRARAEPHRLSARLRRLPLRLAQLLLQRRAGAPLVARLAAQRRQRRLPGRLLGGRLRPHRLHLRARLVARRLHRRLRRRRLRGRAPHRLLQLGLARRRPLVRPGRLGADLLGDLDLLLEREERTEKRTETLRDERRDESALER